MTEDRHTDAEIRLRVFVDGVLTEDVTVTDLTQVPLQTLLIHGLVERAEAQGFTARVEIHNVRTGNTTTMKRTERT